MIGDLSPSAPTRAVSTPSVTAAALAAAPALARSAPARLASDRRDVDQKNASSRSHPRRRDGAPPAARAAAKGEFETAALTHGGGRARPTT
eukprot:4582031-Prymnesium_polylepis.1